jgi:hypothetical protein
MIVERQAHDVSVAEQVACELEKQFAGENAIDDN